MSGQGERVSSNPIQEQKSFYQSLRASLTYFVPLAREDDVQIHNYTLRNEKAAI